MCVWNQQSNAWQFIRIAIPKKSEKRVLLHDCFLTIFENPKNESHATADFTRACLRVKFLITNDGFFCSFLCKNEKKKQINVTTFNTHIFSCFVFFVHTLHPFILCTICGGYHIAMFIFNAQTSQSYTILFICAYFIIKLNVQRA